MRVSIHIVNGPRPANETRECACGQQSGCLVRPFDKSHCTASTYLGGSLLAPVYSFTAASAKECYKMCANYAAENNAVTTPCLWFGFNAKSKESNCRLISYCGANQIGGKNKVTSPDDNDFVYHTANCCHAWKIELKL